MDAAIREAIYALDTLHADGVKLASNSRGLYLGDPALDPLMKVLNERGAVRFPKLKIVVPHCGSFLPLAVPRMQSLMPVMNNVGYLKGVDITNCSSKCGTGPVQKCAEPV